MRLLFCSCDLAFRRKTIIQCLEDGRVGFADDVELLNGPRGALSIREIVTWGKWSKQLNGETVGNDGGFEISWRAPGCGFGGATFHLKNGQWKCDDEYMGREFITELVALAQSWDGNWQCHESMPKESVIQTLSTVQSIELRSDGTGTLGVHG